MKIGVDLGGSHIAIGLVQDDKILDIVLYYNDDNKDLEMKEYIFTFVVNGINLLLEKNKLDINDIEFIGIAAPGDIKDGKIIKSANIDIVDFDIKKELSEKLTVNNKKIQVLNDAKCAALAENKYGSLKKYNDSIFLCIGTGIGGAAFIDNKMLIPKKGNGFEFGHMIIEKDGKKCKCGSNGCFEAYCSKKKFKAKILEILDLKEPIKADDLIEIINKNKDNKELQIVINEYINYLAIGISNIVNIFEPEVICIGGSLSHYEKLIFDKLRDEIYNKDYLFNKKEAPKIIAAELENKAGIIGATLIGEL